MKTQIHKGILFMIFMILAVTFVTAQDTFVLFEETSHVYTVTKTDGNNYSWSVFEISDLNNEIIDTDIVEFISGKDTYQTKIKWKQAGEYVLVIEEIGSCQNLKAHKVSVVNTPTIIFDNITDYCSANNGLDLGIGCTVHYTGSLPWTFKYYVDREPAIIPENANEIWTSTFDFVVPIRNTSTKARSYEIRIVEAKSISGLEVKECTQKINILPLPDTKFLDFEPTVMVGTLQSYTASISAFNSYEIFVPDGAVVLNKNTKLSADELHSELSFDIQWGDELGVKKVKLIEMTKFNCYGDTIYADVNVVEFIDFSIELGEDINACIKDEVTLNPKPIAAISQTYTYLWNNGADSPTITVTESGTYSVVVTNESDHVKRDEIAVLFNALPIVDLGTDRYIYEGENLTLDAGDAGADATYLWNTGEITQTINISVEGDYSVTVTNSNGCSNSYKVKVIKKDGQKFTVDLGDEIEICEGDSAYLKPTIDRDIDVTYKWIPDESTAAYIYVDKKGKYCVEVSDKYGNKETVCVDVLINPSPVVDLGTDKSLDVGETVVLDAGNDGISYLWSTNETTSTIEVSATDEYSVIVTNSKGCKGKDTVNIYSQGRRYLPSGFSPNGDGLNDELKVTGSDIKSVTFIIYNRSGQKIFQSNRLDIGWDGTYKGELQRIDTYMYFLKVTLDNNRTETQRGEVTLLN